MVRRKRRALTQDVAVPAATADAGRTAAAPAQTLASSWFRWRDTLFALSLTAVLFVVYRPAWQGGLLWDDDLHVTRPEYDSWDGLRRMWCELKTTPQYYPVVYSTFWLEHQLWGEATLGYHLVNIALHALGALLVLKILQRLQIPGAYWAAATFALHPIQVESVAWMSELKNTLSGVFYLGALLGYLKFDGRRSQWLYAWALLLFVLALLSKTVTATLPAAVLVILWWQRGRLSWRRDVLPLVPFFALALVGGLLSAWMERKSAGAEGAEFSCTVVERLLIAGRALWFYAGKLAWPANLVFVYPRWQVSQGVWWQYVFPAAAVGLLCRLWCLRHRSRAPLAAALYFGGTLFPALGFLNVYPFRYSFVADHFQYLACLGLIVLVAAGAATLARSRARWFPAVGYGLSWTLLPGLAVLSCRQSAMYGDIETLYRVTAQRNPSCWMAYNNLGLRMVHSGRYAEAIPFFEQGVRTNPNRVETYNDLGNTLVKLDRFAEAVERFNQALHIAPDRAETQLNLGAALAALGRLEEAVECFGRAARDKSHYAEAEYNWGLALARLGRPAEAVVHYQHALAAKSQDTMIRFNLAVAWGRLGQLPQAIDQYQQVVQQKPDIAEAQFNLGAALAASGRLSEAVPHYERAVQIKGDSAPTWLTLGMAQARIGRIREAIASGTQAVRVTPDDPLAALFVAWLLATHEPREGGDPARAVELARRAQQLTAKSDVNCLDTLAAAYAAQGDFTLAADTAKEAWQLAKAAGNRVQAVQIWSRLQLYHEQQPYREPAQ